MTMKMKLMTKSVSTAGGERNAALKMHCKVINRQTTNSCSNCCVNTKNCFSNNNLYIIIRKGSS